MKMMAKICLVILAAFALSVSAFAIDMESVLVYWPCDEGEGEDVLDASGNGRDAEWRKGTASRDAGAWVDGPAGFGKALDFSIGNYCVVYETDDDLPLLDACGNEPFTVAYYVKTATDAGKGRTVDFGSHG